MYDAQVERRYQSRLQDIKDRLDQSDSTNRSLQNYVQFLKASYANVFGDVALGSSLHGPSPIWLSEGYYTLHVCMHIFQNSTVGRACYFLIG